MCGSVKLFYFYTNSLLPIFRLLQLFALFKLSLSYKILEGNPFSNLEDTELTPSGSQAPFGCASGKGDCDGQMLWEVQALQLKLQQPATYFTLATLSKQDCKCFLVDLKMIHQ